VPTSKEFAVVIEDRPGTLGKLCQTLAGHGVNILAFQTFETLIRLVVDTPATAKTVLDGEHYSYTETQVAQVKLPHRPGELARAASRLGEANININYAYCGLEAGTNAPLVFFGVTEVGQAAALLEQQAAAAAAKT